MSICHLHDDMVLHLTKFVSARDCLSLALSGANERFSILYESNRRELSLSECYFLLNKPWKRYFKQYIFSSLITVCDMSHCYWLKAKVLLRCIIKMENLEELSIQDTRMSLKKMPQVFEACKKIVTLSMDLKEDNLDEFKNGVMEKESLKCLKKGFRKLTKLELFVFVVPGGAYHYTKSWLVPLGVLTWCKYCINLLINITYKDRTDDDDEIDDEDLMEELLPRLEWMEGLESLSILLGSDSQSHVQDGFTGAFIINRPSPTLKSLERLWVTPCINDEFQGDFGLVSEILGPKVKSILTDIGDWRFNNLSDEMDDDRYCHLEHLGNVVFDNVDEDGLEHLSNLKYVSGQCFEEIEGLDDFISCHPNLEQLRVFLYGSLYRDLLELGDWNLPLLKVLVYHCARLPGRVLDHLVAGCPNIEEFHLEFPSDISSTGAVRFFSTSQFKNLTWLTIGGDSLFDGSYLQSIVENSPNLSRVHLKGSLEADKFFLNLANCLPLARNLRDLRIKWPKSQNDHIYLPVLLKALKLCPSFERLALVAKAPEYSPIHYTPLQDLILQFVKETHLVALCLVGLPIDPLILEQQFIQNINPDRPAFWFYVGSKLPEAKDHTIPRIHYEGMVNPNNPYSAPPCF